jgi:hypothetical protein
LEINVDLTPIIFGNEETALEVAGGVNSARAAIEEEFITSALLKIARIANSR